MSEERQQDELEVAGPGGMKIRARGYDILVIAVIVGVSLIGYVLYEHKGDAKAGQETMRTEITKSLDKVSQSQEELSYLISLTPEQRAKLSLEMPDSLRRRIRDR